MLVSAIIRPARAGSLSRYRAMNVVAVIPIAGAANTVREAIVVWMNPNSPKRFFPRIRAVKMDAKSAKPCDEAAPKADQSTFADKRLCTPNLRAAITYPDFLLDPRDSPQRTPAKLPRMDAVPACLLIGLSNM